MHKNNNAGIQMKIWILLIKFGMIEPLTESMI